MRACVAREVRLKGDAKVTGVGVERDGRPTGHVCNQEPVPRGRRRLRVLDETIRRHWLPRHELVLLGVLRDRDLRHLVALKLPLAVVRRGDDRGHVDLDGARSRDAALACRSERLSVPVTRPPDSRILVCLEST